MDVVDYAIIFLNGQILGNGEIKVATSELWSNKNSLKIMREWGRKGFPMLQGKGYDPRHGTYVIYQWNVYGFRFHANFYYEVGGAVHVPF